MNRQKQGKSMLSPADTKRTIAQLGALYTLDHVAVVSTPVEIRDTRVGPSQRLRAEDGALSLDAANVIFSGPTTFAGTTFDGAVRFAHAAFLEPVNFTGTTFTGRASFDAAWFGARAVFSRARFSRAALLPYSRFADQAGFQAAEFSGRTAFDDARFCGSTDFRESRFSSEASFPAVRVARDAAFTGAAFPRGASFAGSEFAGELDLTNIQSEGILSFTAASVAALNVGMNDAQGLTFNAATLDFSGGWVRATRLHNVTFAHPLLFSSADLGKPVVARTVFRDIDVSRNRRMAASPARFACPSEDSLPWGGPDTQIEHVTFRDDVSFHNAKFRGETSISEVTFGKTADLTGAVFKAKVGTSGPALRLSRVHADTMNIEWKNLPGLDALKRDPTDPPLSLMLEELVAGYKTRNRDQDALRAKEAMGWMEWREARDCVNSQSPQTTFRLPPFTVPAATANDECSRPVAAIRLATLPFWGVSSGFGTSLSRLIFWIVMVDLTFALIYARFGTIASVPGTASDDDGSAAKLRFLELPGTFVNGGGSGSSARFLPGFRQALALSTVILLRFGAKNATVSGSAGPVPLRRVVTLEWIVGIFLLLDLGYTLHSQPFVQEILHGLLG